ncbi:hypothetical protein OHA18_43055 [Kribbella sp. NBC_00709]|uniref:hypothetical protein n=1 Tax=Kribbella sp. NBC_00709 TaxID=2975972 RepID=UPI002E2AE429|nr:hypothetical protein [Kribbella sp. NBC_00709]
MPPDQDPIWVTKTSTAAELLPHMLERFRLHYQDPLIFGDTHHPEAVIIPFDLWRSLCMRVLDEDGLEGARPVDESEDKPKEHPVDNSSLASPQLPILLRMSQPPEGSR